MIAVASGLLRPSVKSTSSSVSNKKPKYDDDEEDEAEFWLLHTLLPNFVI